MKGSEGFTLIEVIVVVSLIGLLTAIASPYFMEIIKNAQYREASRHVASALRDARARAISENREHRVEFDLDAYRFWMAKGNRANDSTLYVSILELGSFPENIRMATGEFCVNTVATDGDGDSTTSENQIEFNPNGTSASTGSANSPYICILDKDGHEKYRVGVTSTTTGRVAIAKWDPSTSAFE